MMLALALFLVVGWSIFFIINLQNSPYKFAYLGSLFIAASLVWLAYIIKLPMLTGNITTFLTFSIFVSSLVLTTFSDLFEMMVPRFCSIWLVPFWITFAAFGATNISFQASAIGAVIGYLLPWGIAWLFWKFSGKRGIGEGDMEFTSMIGSFLGPYAALMTLNLGAILGIVIGLPYLYFIQKNIYKRIPFAPALTLGAFITLFWIGI